MFVHTVTTPGLAALSYVVGDAGHAAVIDPRRDVAVYLEVAREKGVQITEIIETHRNEDYVVGSCELAAHTGARVLHGPGLDFEYGETIEDGATLTYGQTELQLLRTPGHTDESISIVLRHRETGDSALGVFTGDALFVGDVGRTDFHPDRQGEDAAALYASLHDVLLPLGEHCLVYPAHGAGSVCGDGMADRNFTTLGYEARHNPMLQMSKSEFVAAKEAEHHETPPYFKRMEHLNRVGPAVVGAKMAARPISPDALADRLDSAPVIDVREPQAFAGSHVPGTINLPVNMLAAYAGWLLPYDTEITLIADDADQREAARTHLRRLGYEQTRDYLKGGVTAWEVSGRAPGGVPVCGARALRDMLDEVCVLDVRKRGEYEGGHLPGAVHAFLGRLPEQIAEMPDDRPIITFCGSGRRAMIAASLLRKAGVKDVRNCFGSMKAWMAIDGPLAD